MIRGHIDRVTPEGLVFGWCLDDERPGERLDVTIRADGIDVGVVRAAGAREDLREAGVGDGRHGFILTLPMTALRQRRAALISAFHAPSGTALGEAVVYRADPTTTFDDRLTRIESDMLIIRNRLQVRPSGDAAIATLFEAVGSFFARLGQDLRDGRPSADGFGLPGQMDVLATTYADIRLPLVSAPRHAVFLRANAPLDRLHERLGAIATARMVGQAEVFLLDGGERHGAALLPGVARNLRYLRLASPVVSSIDAIARSMHHETLIFLDGDYPVEADWLDRVIAHLAVYETVGLIGIEPVSIPTGAGPVPAATLGGAETSLRAVDASAFAVRAGALAMSEGFDDGFADLDAAVVDLCYRLRGAGWASDAAPAPSATPAPTATAQDPDRRRSLALLEQRWPDALANSTGGIAACLFTGTTGGIALIAAIAALRRGGHRPVAVCLVERHAARGLEPSLMQAHVQVVWTGAIDRAIAVLKKLGRDLASICAASSDLAEVKSACAKAGIEVEPMSFAGQPQD